MNIFCIRKLLSTLTFNARQYFEADYFRSASDLFLAFKKNEKRSSKILTYGQTGMLLLPAFKYDETLTMDDVDVISTIDLLRLTFIGFFGFVSIIDSGERRLVEFLTAER
ncbi:unnamed protein product [Rhizophagus irregularis]|nr:unnamed protein product [Rhizophagus irregularis]